MPNVSVPGSLYGGSFKSRARSVVVTLASNERIVTVELAHGLGAVPDTGRVVRRAPLAANVSLPVGLTYLSSNASLARFNLDVPAVPGSGKDIGGTFDFEVEIHHTLTS